VLLLPQGHPLSKAHTSAGDIAAASDLPFQSETRILVDEFFKVKAIPYTVSLELTGRDAVKKYSKEDSDIYHERLLFRTSDKEKMRPRRVQSFGQTSPGFCTEKEEFLSCPPGAVGLSYKEQKLLI